MQDIRLYCGFVESFAGLATINVETGSRDAMPDRGGEVGMTRTERIPHLKLADAYALRAKLLDITAMRYPQGKTPLRATMPLSAKKPLKKTVASVGIFGVQIFLVLVLAVVLIPQPFSWIAIGLLALFLIVNAVSVPVHLWYERLYMAKYFYDENGEVLVIRKGVFGWSEIVVPYRNIQSIYVDQDWYDVYYDLWDVWITTVTSASGPMAHIDGLERADAERLARLLVERVESSRKR
jgi:membrane protein YdbS with pleckstrin-like domain